MEPNLPRRLRRDRTALLVVDFQERLLPAIHDPESVVAAAVQLIRGARELDVPVLLTEQYPRGLGPTVEPVRTAVGALTAFEKTAFSAWGAAGLPERLRDLGAADILLCGIEAHVCVCQTALDLLDAGFRVFVAEDAVSSRTRANRTIGLDRMRQAGALPVSVEMVLFELLTRAGTEEFKRVLKLVK
ncbi:MAG: hydrolase [Verrucomicrobiales bacterium]|nr:hydrolase [Verrucomicrobiales bacterium]MCP5528291.1 hydrolase [Verrucomicrobiales bacterium]